MGNYYETKHDAFHLKFKDHEVFKDKLVVVDDTDTPYIWLDKESGKVSFGGKYFHLYKEQRLVEALKKFVYIANEFVNGKNDEHIDYTKRFKEAIAFVEEIEQDFKKNDKCSFEGLKDVLVFQVCECDSVAAYSCEEAVAWYKEETGLDGDELYEWDEIKIVPFDKKFWKDEERRELITVKEIVNNEWDGKPFIVTSELC
jgi:hypothetical protein